MWDVKSGVDTKELAVFGSLHTWFLRFAGVHLSLEKCFHADWTKRKAIVWKQPLSLSERNALPAL